MWFVTDLGADTWFVSRVRRNCSDGNATEVIVLQRQ